MVRQRLVKALVAGEDGRGEVVEAVAGSRGWEKLNKKKAEIKEGMGWAVFRCVYLLSFEKQ